MRFSGQGLMSHTSSTTISRYFNKRRGRALSGIWFGLSSAEFVLPILIVFLLTLFSWRIIWQFISLFIIITLPFVVFYTIRNITIESRITNSKAYSLRKVSFEENKSFNKSNVEKFINFHKKKLKN